MYNDGVLYDVNMGVRKISFSKMHGCGNDYVYVDTFSQQLNKPEELAVQWSARHTGIGGDGLVVIGRASVAEADFSMRIFNADGSEAMMCGNASRCVAKYLYDNHFTTHRLIRLQTLSGIKLLELHVDALTNSVNEVTVDMGEPLLSDANLFVPDAMDGKTCGIFVSMGNPHFVVFVENVDDVDVALEGSRLENHRAFPERCNIEFAEMRENGIRMRVWERGSGITMACGTGACATAVAAAVGRNAPRRNKIIMDGGSLRIEWRKSDNHVYMTGPATFVFKGEISM